MADAPDGAVSGPSPLIFREGAANPDFEVQLYIDNLDEGTGSLPLLLIAELDGKTLVAVPQEAWHRSPSRRKMAPGALAKQALVEVLAADAGTREELDEEHFIKSWVGFLREDLGAHLQPLEHMTDCAINFGSYKDLFVIPSAQSLIAAANEHFAFFSAEEGEEFAEEVAASENPPSARLQEGGESGLGALQGRVNKIESTLELLTSGVNKLLEHAKQEKPVAKATGVSLPRPAVSGKTVSFPHLDQGVVQAALQAGVPHHNLLQMEKLVSQNQRAKRWEISTKISSWIPCQRTRRPKKLHTMLGLLLEIKLATPCPS